MVEKLFCICKNNNLLGDILIIWNNVKSCDNYDKSHYILWNNSEIKKGNKTRYWKDWHDNVIKYIHHWYDVRVNTFYIFQDFKLIYDINDNDFLVYTSLIKQIPLNIVQSLDVLFITTTRRNTIMTDISSAKQACKLCYSLQLNSNLLYHQRQSGVVFLDMSCHGQTYIHCCIKYL